MCLPKSKAAGVMALLVTGFALSGCSFFKKDPVIPEMVFDAEGKYTVVEETAFFLNDPESSEPERMLPPGADLRYVGPGPDPKIITVSEGGQEGLIYASALEELIEPVVVSQKRKTSAITAESNTSEVSIGEQDPSVPKIRIDGPGDIRPRDLGIAPR